MSTLNKFKSAYSHLRTGVVSAAGAFGFPGVGRSADKAPGDERRVHTDPRDTFSIFFPRNLTVQQVVSILRVSRVGDFWQLWALTETMLDSWPMLKKCQHELRSAVSLTKFTVHPFTENGKKPTKQAQQRADLVNAAMKSWKPRPDTDECGMSGLIYDLTNAFLLGCSVVELQWQDAKGERLPRAATFVHPGHTSFDPYGRICLSNIRGQAGSIELDPNYFLCSKFKSQSGSFLASGMIRPVATWWVMMMAAQQWMFGFAQKHGNPYTFLTYARNLMGNIPELDRLEANLRDSGANRYLMAPEGTVANIHPPGTLGNENPQRYLKEQADKEVQMLILGQSHSTEGTPGMLGAADGQMEVRTERKEEVARWIGDVLTEQFARAVLLHNYGNDDFCPLIEPDFTQVESRQETAARVSTEMNTGLPFLAEEVYNDLNRKVPEPGDQVVQNGVLGMMEDTEKPIQPTIEQQIQDQAQMMEAGLVPEGVTAMDAAIKQAVTPIKASAFVGDVSLGALPDDVAKEVQRFVPDARNKTRLARYGMTAAELMFKIDQHNWDTAWGHVANQSDWEEEKERSTFEQRRDGKFILLVNDRIVDGHHFLAKANRLNVTSSLNVLDLTPARFQIKASTPLTMIEGDTLKKKESEFETAAIVALTLAMELELDELMARFRQAAASQDPEQVWHSLNKDLAKELDKNQHTEAALVAIMATAYLSGVMRMTHKEVLPKNAAYSALEAIETPANPFPSTRRAIEDRARVVARLAKAQVLQEVRDSVQETGSHAEVMREASSNSVRLENSPIIRRHAVINAQDAEGYGLFVRAQEELATSPFQELYRAEDRKIWRDWPARWDAQGGQFYPGVSDYPDGRMIAPVNDGIWGDISAWGNPYPPFDYNSGMSVRPVSVAEAKKLGLKAPRVAPMARSFNKGFSEQAGLDDDLSEGFDNISASSPTFEELHPRQGAGHAHGGQFTKKPTKWMFAADKIELPLHLEEMTKIGGNLGGSCQAEQWKDKEGNVWYVKTTPSGSHARNEMLASRLYAAAGVTAPELKWVKGHPGKIASRIMKTIGPADLSNPGTANGFAADAWLANWDVVGANNDNLLALEDNEAIRIDCGGALAYRAQGSPKGDAFGKDPGEINSLRDLSGPNPKAAKVFSEMTQDDVKASISNTVAKISDAQIKELCVACGVPGSLAETLIARRDALMALVGDSHGKKVIEQSGPDIKGKVHDINNELFKDLQPIHDVPMEPAPVIPSWGQSRCMKESSKATGKTFTKENWMDPAHPRPDWNGVPTNISSLEFQRLADIGRSQCISWKGSAQSGGACQIKRACIRVFAANGIVHNSDAKDTLQQTWDNDRIVRMMYRDTQLRLAGKGVDEHDRFLLYRGISAQVVTAGVVEGHTPDKKKASQFDGHDIIKRWVPPVEVLLDNRSSFMGNSCEDEKEWLIFAGGFGTPDHVSVSDKNAPKPTGTSAGIVNYAKGKKPVLKPLVVGQAPQSKPAAQTKQESGETDNNVVVTDEMITQIKDMYNAGHSYEAIGKKFGIPEKSAKWNVLGGTMKAAMNKTRVKNMKKTLAGVTEAQWKLVKEHSAEHLKSKGMIDFKAVGQATGLQDWKARAIWFAPKKASLATFEQI